MRKAPLFLTLTAILMCLPATSEAKNRDKAWEFGAFVTHTYTDHTSGVDYSYGPSVRFGYGFSAKLGAELSLDMTSTEIDSQDADFLRAAISITGNFLTDHDTNTIPYVSAGLGVINETIDAYDDPDTGEEVLESFDSAALLTLAVGARTFFTDDWGVRYEARYNHHDSFSRNQDEYVLGVGITWLVGGQQ